MTNEALSAHPIRGFRSSHEARLAPPLRDAVLCAVKPDRSAQRFDRYAIPPGR